MVSGVGAVRKRSLMSVCSIPMLLTGSPASHNLTAGMNWRKNVQRIREVEHASFTPLVLSACGGLVTGASTFYKRLASLLAENWESPTASLLVG